MPHARLLFIGLWTIADREGLLKDLVPVIAGQIFPFEPKINVDNLLGLLHNGGFITRYEKDGGKYICINNFKKHQSIHPHEEASVIPFPDNVIKCNDMQLQAIHGQYVDVDVNVDVDVKEDVDVNGQKAKLKVILLPIDKYDKFKAEYPKLNVDKELLRCDEYFDPANNKKVRKVKNPVSTFRNWLERAHRNWLAAERQKNLANNRALIGGMVKPKMATLDDNRKDG